MSVVAQQMLTIQSAKAQNAVKVVFQETTLKLDASCGIFVTINPDYPGNFRHGDKTFEEVVAVVFVVVFLFVNELKRKGTEKRMSSAASVFDRMFFSYLLCVVYIFSSIPASGKFEVTISIVCNVTARCSSHH